MAFAIKCIVSLQLTLYNKDLKNEQDCQARRNFICNKNLALTTQHLKSVIIIIFKWVL